MLGPLRSIPILGRRAEFAVEELNRRLSSHIPKVALEWFNSYKAHIDQPVTLNEDEKVTQSGGRFQVNTENVLELLTTNLEKIAPPKKVSKVKLRHLHLHDRATTPGTDISHQT